MVCQFALSAVTFGSFAANDKAPECRKGRECNQKVRCEQKQCDRKARPCPNPFEGLNLTESQNTQLEALRASQPCGKDSAACKRGDRKADIHKDGNRGRKHKAMHNGNCNNGNRDKCDRNKAKKD